MIYRCPFYAGAGARFITLGWFLRPVPRTPCAGRDWLFVEWKAGRT